jgi:tetratricopeptide (TPR) repeat protein
MFVALRSPWHLFDSSDEVLALFQPESEGVLAIENVALSANAIAALALSHMWTRNDPVMAARTAAISLKSGESANGRVFTAELLGTAYLKDTRKILSRLDRAVQLEPDGFIPRVARASFFYDTDDTEKALQDVQVALSVEPEYWPARRLKLDILTDMGRHEEARTEAEILLDSPFAELDVEIWADAAQLAVNLGRLSDGAREMNHYLQLSPSTPEDWSWLEDVLKILGQQQSSAMAAENATLSAINVIRDAHRDARYLEQLGQTDEAIESLEDIIMQDPDYAMARADLARLKGTEL